MNVFLLKLRVFANNIIRCVTITQKFQNEIHGYAQTPDRGLPLTNPRIDFYPVKRHDLNYGYSGSIARAKNRLEVMSFAVTCQEGARSSRTPADELTISERLPPGPWKLRPRLSIPNGISRYQPAIYSGFGRGLKSIDFGRRETISSPLVAAVRIKRITSRAELEKAYSIRLRVFVKEQGVPWEMELDEEDKTAIHFLATREGHPVGTARLIIKHGQGRIGRMAVLKSLRGRRIGQGLLKSAVRSARRRGVGKIFLHAQLQVVGFYEKMGFRAVGPVFTEAGIRHRKMILNQVRSKKAKVKKSARY